MTVLRIAFCVLLGLAVALTAAVGLWLTHPTSLYYRHISSQIERDESGTWFAVITRELPRGSFPARWSMEVWVRRGEASFVCQLPMQPQINYNAAEGPTVRYQLPPEVTRCLDSAPPISITWTRQAMLWGWIPLQPTVATLTLSEAIPVTLSDE